MKYVIDESVCKEHNLTLPETLCLLACKSCDNIYQLLEDMEAKEAIAFVANLFESGSFPKAVLFIAEKCPEVASKLLKFTADT